MFYQHNFRLPSYKRGFHLITDLIEQEIQSDLKKIEVGLVHVFIQHTSASLTINENADPTVRTDFESHMNVMIPEDAPYYIHTYEGPDDLPAHIKASLLGSSVSIPVTNGSFNLGVWQGVYLCEHRDRGGNRNLVITLQGE
ncbi:MAG: secondary thiamine-phosphate synthase enzyme YjbQ [Cyclobacteriaceae bacterium]